MADTNFRPKYISYDVYGTLINFNIYPTTQRLLGDRIPDEQWLAFKKVFRAYRFDEVLGDYKPYEQILQDAFDRACKRFGIGPTPGAGAELAEAVRKTVAHEDVPAALELQGDNNKLVALSNADDSFLDISIPKLGADWHAVLAAEQAGAYKPRLQAFEYMLDTLNAKPEDFLHDWLDTSASCEGLSTVLHRAQALWLCKDSFKAVSVNALTVPGKVSPVEPLTPRKASSIPGQASRLRWLSRQGAVQSRPALTRSTRPGGFKAQKERDCSTVEIWTVLLLTSADTQSFISGAERDTNHSRREASETTPRPWHEDAEGHQKACTCFRAPLPLKAI